MKRIRCPELARNPDVHEAGGMENEALKLGKFALLLKRKNALFTVSEKKTARSLPGGLPTV
jgi:hypothetical protein